MSTAAATRLVPSFFACAVLGGGLAALRAQPENETAPTPVVFGAMTHFAQGWHTDLVPRLAATGITEVRDELYWDAVEPQPGVFKFPASYEAYMASLRSAGVLPLIELTFENRNYDGGLTPYTDAGIAAYARYGTTLLQHYGSQISAVEVWNEYNGTWCRGPATADRAATYARMLAATYTAIKHERPDVTVVGGATAGLPLPYLERLFTHGALQSMDAVSVHPYRTDSPPEGIEFGVAALKQLIARYSGGRSVPIWATEIGWGTHVAAAPGDLTIDEPTQAKYLVRALTLLASGGAERVYWYLARDDHVTPTMGLLRNDTGYPAKKAALAMAALQSQLHNAVFVRREATADGIYSLVFNRENVGPVRVLWALTPFSLAVPNGARVLDLYGENVVPAAGGRVEIDDSPVYVTGDSLPLPAAATEHGVTEVADSVSGFSPQQGRGDWSYGAFVGDSPVFHPLTKYHITDWLEEWTDVYPYISITSDRQHPSKSGTKPVASVRRWTSDFSGTIHVTGRFKSLPQGDGVRAKVLVDGAAAYSASLGGGHSIVGDFDFTRVVNPGSTVDFAVDPGPAANIDYDSTAVAAVIKRVSP
jgi:hypothetical protein